MPRPWPAVKEVLHRACPAAAAVLLAVLAAQLFLVRGYRLEGACMEPNVRPGERVLVTRFDYWLGAPARGDVVVFPYPRDPARLYIKRVIAVGGELVEIRAGRVYIDGEPVREPLVGRHQRQYFGPLVVPPGRLFVLGDNRDNSNDSRYWGCLPASQVIGRVRFRYWPLGRAGALPREEIVQAGSPPAGR